ncbi:putative tocopherol O-methyltransferase [Aureobasidium pullulans EXF-150]|uniref:Sterol 24-C-methyltransferase n=1 Tax=Aureobasidium pullulans EXF-150 TaxID=1043002 RepID=A0A074XJG1_AURPU|nr:putative tocopherol O-methyltransferase [Aureobasidium pullulans EXF-150]KEQ82177.1 putative tocopherol O-methyltransferase [Aureobasidium pullulans EXF-150]
MAVTAVPTSEQEFTKLMHGKSATERNAFISMLRKDGEAHRLITDEYVQRWTEDSDAARKSRQDSYMSLVNNYYDLATDLYCEGWGESFHLCRFAPKESLIQALARHEHYLAHMINIKENHTVLDVGCGIGGPAREIATFAGCKVVGVNNNRYQIERATALTAKRGLSEKVSFVQGNFMHLSFLDNTFDAVYAIEATCHAPVLEGVYSQMYRVAKPGATVEIYEWVMTDRYDEANPEHRKIRHGIERGNGISNMVTRKEAERAFKNAGFELLHDEDLAERSDARPWYAPLSGNINYATGAWDVLGAIRMTKFGRFAMETLLTTLETVRLAPSGTAETAKELSAGADALVAGGKAGLFSPMYLMVGKKPL